MTERTETTVKKPSDDTIRRQWRWLRSLYWRGVYNDRSLHRGIALALADRMESEGVTDEDLYRLGLSERPSQDRIND